MRRSKASISATDAPEGPYTVRGTVLAPRGPGHHKTPGPPIAGLAGVEAGRFESGRWVVMRLID